MNLYAQKNYSSSYGEQIKISHLLDKLYVTQQQTGLISKLSYSMAGKILQLIVETRTTATAILKEKPQLNIIRETFWALIKFQVDARDSFLEKHKSYSEQCKYTLAYSEQCNVHIGIL